MRIGLFTDTYYPEKNGVAVSTYQLKRGLEALGHQVYVFTIENREAEPDSHVFRLKAVSAMVVDGQRMAVPLFRHYLKIIEKLQLDVIHTQTEFPVGILGWRAARRFGIPHVHTYHTVYEEYTNYLHLPGSSSAQMKSIVRKLSAWWCNQADLVVAPTRKTQELLQSYQVSSEMRVIPTGLQLEKFEKPDREHVAKLREHYGLQPEDRVLVYLGRVSGEKNIDRLLHYVEEYLLKEQNTHLLNKRTEPVMEGENGKDCGSIPFLKLLIVGGGPAEESLHELAKPLAADGRVIFTGMVPWDQVQDYYALGDIFVSASTSETQGLTYYEAMASGLPVLARRDDCLELILTDGIQGYQFDDDESFQFGLQAILTDLESFSGHARETAAAYSAGTFAERVEEGYRSVAGSGHGTGRRKSGRFGTRAIG